MNNENHRGSSHEEHETHVPAVLFLVLITVVVVAVAVVYGFSGQQLRNLTTDQPSRQGESDPVSYVQADSVTQTDDIPAGLFLGNPDIVSNRKFDIGSRQQRVVVFNTQLSLQDASEQYRQWIQSGEYTLENVSIGESSQSITASNGGSDELIIMLNENNKSQSRVQLSYIKSSSQ